MLCALPTSAHQCPTGIRESSGRKRLDIKTAEDLVPVVVGEDPLVNAFDDNPPLGTTC